MVKMKTFSGKLLPVISTMLLVLVFALVIPKAPLYQGNQNTYLVRGLANAGAGFLNLDWFVNTADPMPVFSALVSFAVQVRGENAIYFLFMIILIIYSYSIMGLTREIIGSSNLSFRYFVFFTLFTLWHSGILEDLLLKIPSMEQFDSLIKQSMLLIRGVAKQYILGNYFQPSTFGVLLVLSIYCFIREKPYWAVICIAIAATFHSTYLLSAAVLTCSYMAIIIREEKDYRKALLLGGTAFVLVVPILIYIYLIFNPTTANIYTEAQSILVDYRIPHHAKVSSWFGCTTIFQLCIVTLSLYLIRRTNLFPVLLSSFLAALILTTVQVLTESKFLALLFPWRISVYLVPIGSAIILAKIVSMGVQSLAKPLSKFRRPLYIVLVSAILFLGYYGIRQTNELRYTSRVGVPPSVKFVRRTFQPGNLYLIPIDMMSFRLAARVPIFIDFKSHPYKDTELIEWYERVNIANEFYSSTGDEACTILINLATKYEVSHVMFRRESSIPYCGSLDELYSDGDFKIFKVKLHD